MGLKRKETGPGCSEENREAGMYKRAGMGGSEPGGAGAEQGGGQSSQRDAVWSLRGRDATPREKSGLEACKRHSLHFMLNLHFHCSPNLPRLPPPPLEMRPKEKTVDLCRPDQLPNDGIWGTFSY